MATCSRLLWKVVDESTVVTDLGRTIHFELDPPKAVEMEVDEAVRRWRWRRIVKHDGDVDADIAGRGAFMEPIWKLLRSRQNDDEWNPVLRGSLRSALANRQYPQCRVKAAGWSVHDKCLFCLNSNIEDSLSCGAMRDRCKEIAKEGKAKSSRRDLAGEATGEILAATPKGTLGHRIYECPRLSGSRDKYADNDVVSRGIANPGTLDYERAMKQRPPIPSTKQCKEETFEWEVEPVCGWFEGTVYPDGSLRDGKFAELARSGWSFVVIDDKGRIVAAANGVPPGWIVDIGGAEAWAIYQAARFAVPGRCRYISDSLTTVRALQAGIGACTAAGKKYARVYRLCSEELDGTPPEMLIWMPAHKTKGQAARCLMSNGEVLTETHRDANDRADVLAKKAVEVHRVRKEEYELWVQTYEETQTAAKWIARATHEANNQAEYPFQDSEAARWRSEAATAERRKAKYLRSKRIIIIDKLKVMKRRRSPEHGGHTVERVLEGGLRSKWRCKTCKVKSGTKAELESQNCKGDPKLKWAIDAVDPEKLKENAKRSRLNELDAIDYVCDMAEEVEDVSEQRPHEPVLRGSIIVCTVCGAYAENKAVKLKGECRGRPKFSGSYGGAWGQHKKVTRGIHPRTNEVLPPPKRLDGSLWQPGTGKYSNLKADEATISDVHFYRYVSVPDIVAAPRVREISVQQLNAERFERVRKRHIESTVVSEVVADTLKRRRLRSKGPACRG